MPRNQTSKPSVLPINLENIQVPEYYRLSNGVSVFEINGGNEEVTKIDFIFRAGQILEQIPLQASTTIQMLLEGSKNHSADQINRKLDYYGITINTSSDKDSATLSVLFLNRYLSDTLQLCREILFYPDFPEKELKSLMDRRLQTYLINREKVSALASEAFFGSVFGKNHPYGVIIQPADFLRIEPNHLKDFHNRYYHPAGLTLIVSGKTHPDTRKVIENFFGSLRVAESALPEHPPLPCGEKEKYVFVPKENAVQSAIRIGSQTIKRSNPDFPSLLVVNTILGGFFGSRLMKNLREDKGFTYGVYSNVVSLDLAGFLVISADVGKKYTKKAVNEIFKEIKLLQEKPVKKKELTMVRNYMMSDLVRMFDGPFVAADSIRLVWESGLDISYFHTLAEKIKIIKPDEIMHTARTYYCSEDLVIVIAGPGK